MAGAGDGAVETVSSKRWGSINTSAIHPSSPRFDNLHGNEPDTRNTQRVDRDRFRVTRFRLSITGDADRIASLQSGYLLARWSWFRSQCNVGTALFVFDAAYGALDVAMNAQAVAVEARWGRQLMSSFHGTFSTGTLLAPSLAAVSLLPPICLALGLRWRCWRWWPPFSAVLVVAEGDEDGPAFALPVGPLAGVGALAFGVLLAEERCKAGLDREPGRA